MRNVQLCTSYIQTVLLLQPHKLKVSFATLQWRGPTVTEFWSPHGMEEGKGERYLASGRQYGNALLGVRHQEEEEVALLMMH